MRKLANSVVRSFLEGLIIVVPFGLTTFLVVYTLAKTKAFIQSFFSLLTNHMPYMSQLNSIPYLNIIIVLSFITFLGYIASNFLVKSMIHILEEMVMGVPVINIIYSYIKDSTSAFMDKFDKPVLVTINQSLDIKKIGFITQEALDNLPVEDTKVAVYVPHSYSFSGELIVLDKQHVAYLGISATDALRLILSGGLANLDRPHKTFVKIGQKINSELLEEHSKAIVPIKKRKGRAKKS